MLAARPALIGRVRGIVYRVIGAQEVDQAAADLAPVKSLAVGLARELGRLSFTRRGRPLSRGEHFALRWHLMMRWVKRLVARGVAGQLGAVRSRL
jgi:hypothetical protein